MKKYNFLRLALFSIEDIKKEIDSESNLFYSIKKLIDSNIIKKLKGGLYATINPLTSDIFANKYEIATSLHKDCAIAYHSALEYYGLANQVFNEVQIISKKNYSDTTIEGIDYIFYNNLYNDGIIEIEQNDKILITDLERTIIDCIDRIAISGGLEEVYTALLTLDYCEEKKLLYYLEKYNKKLLYKKIGFLFSLIKPNYLSNDFYEICKKNMSKREDDIRENTKLHFEYNKEWELYVPKQIINIEN